ncbi:MAG: hypothetical protein IJR99_04450 [Kiritimatiellae bacterium]|nr:hypothetical protein [Kiritimatiellia bacterium]
MPSKKYSFSLSACRYVRWFDGQSAACARWDNWDEWNNWDWCRMSCAVSGRAPSRPLRSDGALAVGFRGSGTPAASFHYYEKRQECRFPEQPATVCAEGLASTTTGTTDGQLAGGRRATA